MRLERANENKQYILSPTILREAKKGCFKATRAVIRSLEKERSEKSDKIIITSDS